MLLITGSSSGIGKATAELAVARGHNVMLHGRNEAKLKEAAKNLGMPYVCVDVTDREKTLAVLGSLDEVEALIHCCGEYRAEPLLSAEDEHWLGLYRTNTLGFLHVVQAVVPHLIAHGRGRIVHIISTRCLPHMANNRGAAYSVSKAAALNLTIALAKELAPKSITVNAVSPGYTITEIAAHWTDMQWANARKVSLGRPAEAREIADMLLFLATSEGGGYTTGQNFVIDGGQTVNF